MSLHLWTNLVDYYLLTQNLTFLSNVLFFVHIIIGSFFVNSTAQTMSRSLLNFLKFYTFSIVTMLTLLFGIKFYSKFYFMLPTQTIYYAPGLSPFSDILVILSLVITLIGWVYLGERNLYKNFFSLNYFFIFTAATNCMVSTSNYLVMFIFFEFIFLPSLFFVYQYGYAQKVEKTIGYLLLWTLTGSFIVLFALLYLFGVTNSLEASAVAAFTFTPSERNVLFLAFFIGFGIKIPLWPFHYWLTKVHVEAPTGFSIFLSGYLVKTAFFCLSCFFSKFATLSAILIALVFVSFGFIDASIRMWMSTDIKRLVAFATIQEMNLIMLFFLLLRSSNLYIVNLFLFFHGVLSALMFYLVDNVQKREQTRNLVSVGGLAFYAPKFQYIVWVTLLVFRGFPLFVKFLIEWNLLAVLVLTFGYFGLLLFAACALFGVLGFCRVWFTILYGQPAPNASKIDILKKDWIVGIFLIFLLVCISFAVVLFYG